MRLTCWGAKIKPFKDKIESCDYDNISTFVFVTNCNTQNAWLRFAIAGGERRKNNSLVWLQSTAKSARPERHPTFFPVALKTSLLLFTRQ